MKAPDAAVMRPLFGFLLAVYLLTSAGHLYLGDAWSMLRTAESVVTRGELAIPFDLGQGGKFAPDGKYYAKYGPGVAAHMLAPALIGRVLRGRETPAASAKPGEAAVARAADASAKPGEAAARATDAGAKPGDATAAAEAVAKRDLRFGLAASFLNAPFVALIGAMFFGTALALGYRARAAVWGTLALAFGTMLWPYSKHDAFEPQMTAALMVGVWCAVRGAPGHSFLAGLACGWALLVKPVAALAVVPLGFYVWSRRGVRGALGFAAGPSLAVGLTLCYNLVRFGDAFETGYSVAVQGFTIPLWMGLYGLLFSAGKGVLWYSPALVFAWLSRAEFRARHPAEFKLIAWTAALHLLFYSGQQSWDGDWCWGPRYLLPCLPLAMLAALPLWENPPVGWRRAGLGAIGALAMFVQVLGVAVNPSDYVRWLSANKAVMGDFLAQPKKTYIPLHPHHFNPDFSPLRGHLHLLRETLFGGSAPAPLVIYSSVEEFTDRGGHHLERVLELPLAPEQRGLDLWLPVALAIAHGSVVATLAVWVFFALVALTLVKQRRRMWRLVRLSEAG